MIVPRADAGGVKPLRVYTAPPEAGEPTNQVAPVFNEQDLKQVLPLNDFLKFQS